MSGRRRRAERGAVTAELALAMPLLLAVTIGLVWLLAAASAQIRVVDAAREAARIAARGDGGAAARDAALRIAPDGATLRLRSSGEHVEATARARVSGPGGVLGFAAITVEATAIALQEGS